MDPLVQETVNWLTSLNQQHEDAGQEEAQRRFCVAVSQLRLAKAAFNTCNDLNSIESQAQFLARLSTPQFERESYGCWFRVLEHPHLRKIWDCIPTLLNHAAAIDQYLSGTADGTQSIECFKSHKSPRPMKSQTHTLSISKQRCFSLLTALMFGGYAHRGYGQPAFTLKEFWGAGTTAQKLFCLCDYFIRVCGLMETEDGRLLMTQECVNFTLKTQGSEEFLTVERLIASEVPLSPLVLTNALGDVYVSSESAQRLRETCLPANYSGGVEDTIGALKVDFANRFPGGGVLRHGLAQEEILYMIYPELLISCLVCGEMQPQHTYEISNVWRFSDYTGRQGRTHPHTHS
eukprot:Blabericola_migrator_1__475@NODE_1114_length_5386_cov_54_807295_g761_i0_p3_GENE_NODE_1114_length_5386_cov_54_807295_g761_i0NODE_1114_length_5386_cov_54_807295_g761_i0_p3_ORF_typecomplete_len347_score63_85PARG_cat/PF05028_14/1_6e32TAP42/PF04177_12/0_06_NODE_1114_length_5386_cov_54_807295_g761_i042955335